MNNSRFNLVRATDADDASRIAADHVEQLAKESVARHDRFVLAIPGGSSPTRLFDLLCSTEHIGRVPWQRTHLLWVDERCVPIEHPDSNAGAFLKRFLDRLPIRQDQVHVPPVDLPPEDAAQEYERTLLLATAALPEAPPEADLVILGLGEDGHVASLFPGRAADRPEFSSGRWIVPVLDSPKPPPTRITFTLPALRAARNVLVLALGEAKARAVQRCFAGEPLPAALASQGPNRHWVADPAALSLLPDSA